VGFACVCVLARERVCEREGASVRVITYIRAVCRRASVCVRESVGN